jgi:hypothetical protein
VPFADLRARRGADPADLSLVRELVVVASSSRGGSTLLGELLRHVPGTLHLRGESNPLFAVAGEDPAALAAEFVADLGRPAPEGEGDDVIDTLVWRLLAQWPGVGLDPDDVRGWVSATLAEVPFSAGTDFHLRLLRRARAREPRIDPWYYDLPDDAVRAAFPGVPTPSGPPGDEVLEMAPFVLVRPWLRATREQLSSWPVVLTTPRNSFRLPVLQALFPNARVRVLHLTRNPAAAANGLIDGWRHRGFFSADVGPQLDIAGYDGPWADRWWNFDRWPGWEESAGSPLELVCARQWAAPHLAALDAVIAMGLDHHVVRFEHLVGAERRSTLGDLADWLGLPAVLDAADVELPPLMATAPPAPQRWSRRAGRLMPALRDVRVQEVAALLRYDDPRTWV